MKDMDQVDRVLDLIRQRVAEAPEPQEGHSEPPPLLEGLYDPARALEALPEVARALMVGGLGLESGQRLRVVVQIVPDGA